MPTYEFRCAKCNKKFSLIMSISEHGARKHKCPKCGSAKLEQMVSHFQAVTSKKS